MFSSAHISAMYFCHRIRGWILSAMKLREYLIYSQQPSTSNAWKYCSVKKRECHHRVMRVDTYFWNENANVLAHSPAMKKWLFRRNWIMSLSLPLPSRNHVTQAQLLSFSASPSSATIFGSGTSMFSSSSSLSPCSLPLRSFQDLSNEKKCLCQSNRERAKAYRSSREER